MSILKKFTKFLYQLFFTRDDDLDMLQVLFTVIVCVSLMLSWKIVSTSETDPVKIEALTTLRWLAAMLVVTAVPKWLVPAVTGIMGSKKNIDMSIEENSHE
jgi:hypothetical protein